MITALGRVFKPRWKQICRIFVLNKELFRSRAGARQGKVTLWRAKRRQKMHIGRFENMR